MPLDDFTKNGLPDYYLVCSAIYIIPGLAEARKRLGQEFRIVYWEHGTLATLRKINKLYSPFKLYKRLSYVLTNKVTESFLRKADMHLAISTGLKEHSVSFLVSTTQNH